MHVADAHARIDRVRRRLDWGDVALGHAPKVPLAAARSSSRLAASEHFSSVEVTHQRPAVRWVRLPALRLGVGWRLDPRAEQRQAAEACRDT
jgi:hypothetical protein